MCRTSAVRIVWLKRAVSTALVSVWRNVDSNSHRCSMKREHLLADIINRSLVYGEGAGRNGTRLIAALSGNISPWMSHECSPRYLNRVATKYQDQLCFSSWTGKETVSLHGLVIMHITETTGLVIYRFICSPTAGPMHLNGRTRSLNSPDSHSQLIAAFFP